MKTKIILLAILFTQCVLAQTRTITDMAGRKVSIPEKINRILPHDEKTSLFLFPVTGKKMIYRGLSKDALDLKYISKDYSLLPQIDIANIEEVLKAAPDIILVGCFIPEDYSRYEKLSRQTNIPVVILDLNLLKLDDSYKFVSNLLGETAKGKSCITYLSAFYTELSRVRKNTKKRNASVYVAVGSDGLLTAPSGSKHAQLLDLLDIKNAAQTEIQTRGYANVSIEQLMVWKPDFIFTVDKAANDPFPHINTSKLWKDIPAVQKKQVFHIPEEPYSWFGNPPTINRIPGLILLMELFYHYPRTRAHQQLKEFYRLFYNYPLTDAELSELLQNRS